MKHIHYSPKYFMELPHSITVIVVGVGGNGSQVLTDLAKINSSLIALQHPGLSVIAIDDDKVEQTNVGRQKFSSADLGQYKSTVLITRLKRFYGTNWRAITNKFDSEKITGANIIISAVDNVDTRIQIKKWFSRDLGYDRSEKLYWLDFGNGKDYGQFVLGSNHITQPDSKNNTVTKLLNVLELFPNMKENEDIVAPSCSTREALSKQDLFINSVLVSTGMNLLWKLFIDFKIETQGGYVNLKTCTTKPIKL